jgi:hypothetical protein
VSKDKPKKRLASVVGVIPEAGDGAVYWKVRLRIPRVPFFMDSSLSFRTIEEAEEMATKWRKRKVTVTIED